MVVDTSAWIEVLRGRSAGKRLSAMMPVPEGTIVPALVQFELSKWLAREAPPEIAELVMADTTQGVVVPLDTRLAVAAAEVAATFGLAMADAIIYATAQAHDADLLTCDAHFAGLPGVLYIEKSSE